MEDHVILFKYNAATKEHQRFHALVVGRRKLEGHGEPVLNLVHHKPNAHPSFQGLDWIETMERTLDVPHKSDLGNQAYFYLNEGEENPVPMMSPTLIEPPETQSLVPGAVIVMPVPIAETVENVDDTLAEDLDPQG